MAPKGQKMVQKSRFFLVPTKNSWSKREKLAVAYITNDRRTYNSERPPPLKWTVWALRGFLLWKKTQLGLSISSKAYIYKKSSWPKQKGSNSSQIIQWSSVGHITIHFRGLRVLRRAPKPNFWLFWPKKSFYGNAHISGTRRPTGLAQVSKRPLDQGLRAWHFRLSVFLLVSKIACVLSSPKFWLLDQKFKRAVFARFGFLKSKNPISGHN